jgi:succinyl-CoA synthetase beta subunit
VPRGIVATTPEQVKAAALELGGGVCVVKAQIHAGGAARAAGSRSSRMPMKPQVRA